MQLILVSVWSPSLLFTDQPHLAVIRTYLFSPGMFVCGREKESMTAMIWQKPAVHFEKVTFSLLYNENKALCKKRTYRLQCR